MCRQDFDGDGLVEHIGTHVLGVLQKLHFFELLGDCYSPQDDSKLPAKCEGSFAIAVGILRSLDMDSDDISDVLAVLRSKGGCCDCEVLYNVAEEGRLKTKYWKSRHAGLQSKASIPFQAGN